MTFGADSTSDDVLAGIDLTGTRALVTGGSAGLGVETGRALAAHGARVLLAVRDVEKGERARQEILATVPGAQVDLDELDLADLSSVRRFAARTTEHFDGLELLINNAGVMACPLGRTADGFELQFGTNHLGHFLLTTLLEPLLVAAAPARVIALSSRGHLRSDIHWDDPHYRSRPYDKWEAYGQSKTANILFAVALDARLADQGVRAYSLHPGVIATELSRHLRTEDMAALAARIPAGGLVRKSIPQGAATTLWAATTPQLQGRGGLYLEDCAVSDHVSTDGGSGHAPYALDPQSAQRLWELSVAEVGGPSHV